MRAQSDPYPNAFAYHRGAQLRIVRASVSAGHYGGTPGRIFIKEGDGVVIVAGPEARRGHSLGSWLNASARRTALAAADYFTTMGGYLTDRP